MICQYNGVNLCKTKMYSDFLKVKHKNALNHHNFCKCIVCIKSEVQLLINFKTIYSNYKVIHINTEALHDLFRKGKYNIYIYTHCL